MRPVVVHLEQIDKDPQGLKERLFEWIAELSQSEFDQLCCEILAIGRFFEKYGGLMVTDASKLIFPLDRFIPTVELSIEIDDKHFDKTFFYRWLSDVSIARLQTVCQEIEDAYDEVIENLNTHVISDAYAVLVNRDLCWPIKKDAHASLQTISNVILNWKTEDLAGRRISA